MFAEFHRPQGESLSMMVLLLNQQDGTELDEPAKHDIWLERQLSWKQCSVEPQNSDSGSQQGLRTPTLPVWLNDDNLLSLFKIKNRNTKKMALPKLSGGLDHQKNAS